MLTRRQLIALGLQVPWSVVQVGGRSWFGLPEPRTPNLEQEPGTRTRNADPGTGNAVDLAEWSYHWIGIERVELFRGSVISGTQMYVEYQVPRTVRHDAAVVLVSSLHGQGSDWMTTPDGRPGWLTYLLQDGFRVYLVDLPGTGRVPYSPDLHGPYAQAPTYEEYASLTEPGSLFPAGAAALDQFMAGRGPSPAAGPRTFAVWRANAARLLDTIGPAVIVTHGDTAAFAWGATAERPSLVPGIVALQGGEMPAGLKVPVRTVTAAAAGGAAGTSSRAMIADRNNRDVLQPIVSWLRDLRVAAPRPRRSARADPEHDTSVALADQGCFWLGVERVQTRYGTVAAGQTFVQYLVPAGRRHPYPVVLVHGGGGQGTHWMGEGDGEAGWAHYYLRDGYAVYLLDCPAYGRSPEHPDATGVTGQLRTIDATTFEFRRAKNNPAPRWSGTAEVGDPALDRFLAGEVGFVQRDLATVHTWWARAAEQLLDRIGPAIIQMHTNGGAFAWIAADRRPGLVKGIVWTVLALPDTPFADRLPWGLTAIPVAYDPPAADVRDLQVVRITPPAGSGRPPYRLQGNPPRRLRNLQNVPVLLVSGEYDGRAQVPAVAEYFQQAGVRAEQLRLQDRGIRGNGAMLMMETNRREVYAEIRRWVDALP